MDDGYIVQRSGDDDRRQRLLFATPRGEALVAKLAALQTARIDRALASFAPVERDSVAKFLRGMIDREHPDKVLEALLRQQSAGENA